MRTLAGMITVALAAATVVAIPSAAVASATVASVQLPRGGYELQPGLGAMWALHGDEYTYATLYRIDPNTVAVTETVALGFPAADLTVAYGSVWVTDYYGSTLHRYSASGRVEAVIPVGRQPQFVHAAFGSIWTSDHHSHSVTRIDPASNGVVARINVGARQFRDGPQDFTSDGQHLYVESSNLTYLQRIDPVTNAVTRLADTGRVYGGELVWTAGRLGGTLWNNARSILYGYDVLGSVRVRVRPDHGYHDSGLSVSGGLLYYAEHNSDGSVVIGADESTGATVVRIPVGTGVVVVRGAFGDVWTVGGSGLVQRIEP